MNLLLSFCNYNENLSSFLAIVDPVNYKILWHYVSKDRMPMHTPAMLPNGHILVYVNSSPGLIKEIDPVTNKIIWSYTEKSSKNIKCNVFGSCQRLPNGNTLISNMNGYIYEVTPDKKIVWQWYNNNDRLYRACFYPKEKLNWLINEKLF